MSSTLWAPTAHLHPLFENKPVAGSIRDGFGAGLVAAAKANDLVVGLCADVTESVRMEPFAKAFPERFVELGVAEQNLVGVAAGLALAGKIPVAASYAVFNPGRSWDQLRVSVCYSNLNVKIIGAHAGLSTGPDGATHQALEDLALTQVLPNLIVLSPGDELEAAAAIQAAIAHVGPVYLRLPREKSVLATNPADTFTIGKAKVMAKGKDITFCTTGIMLPTTLEAARCLAEQELSVEVLHFPTVKPLDLKALLASVQKTGAVVVVEEHQQFGGLGSSISQALAQHHPCWMEFVGTKDTFGESGTAPELWAKYHLTSEDVAKAAWRLLEKKQTG